MATEEQTSYNSSRSLYSGATTRHGQRLTIPGRTVTKLSFPLSKLGSPTGNITFTIRKTSDSSLIASKVWGNASSLSTSPAWKEATLDSPVYVNEEVRICVEFEGGNVTNAVKAHYQNTDVKGSEYRSFWVVSTWNDYPTMDSAYIYTYTPAAIIYKSVAGVLSFSGLLGKIWMRVVGVGGSLSFAGAISRFTEKNVQGGLSLVGITNKYTRKLFAGGLTTAGALDRAIQITVSGALSSAGALAKMTQKPIDGAISSAGDLTRNIYKNVAGVLSPSGAITAFKTFIQAISGGLSFAGEVATEVILFTAQAVGGVLSFVGSLDIFKGWTVDLAGGLTLAGSLVKQISKNLIGVLTSSSILERRRFVAISGALTSAGSLVKSTGKNMLGAMKPAGITNKYTRKLVRGTLTLTGSVKKMTSKILSGVLSLVGVIPRPGRELVMRLFHRPHRDMSVEVKPYRDMSVESKDD